MDRDNDRADEYATFSQDNTMPNRACTRAAALAVTVASMSMTGCEFWQAAEGWTDVDVSAAIAMIRERRSDPNFVILDVRTASEFAQERIVGAVNVDWLSSGFGQKMDAFDRTKAYLVYCAGGVRSRSAVARMVNMGFTELYNVPGGMEAFKGSGDAVDLIISR